MVSKASSPRQRSLVVAGCALTLATVGPLQRGVQAFAVVPSSCTWCGGVAPSVDARSRRSGGRVRKLEAIQTMDGRLAAAAAGMQERRRSSKVAFASMTMAAGDAVGVESWGDGVKKALAGVAAGVIMGAALMGGGGSAMADIGGAAMGPSSSLVDASTTAVPQEAEVYDGFADFAAKGQKMEESDVGCFMKECKQPTVSCFTDGSCLKGVTCLGRCKGEQECATRCFAQYGSKHLDEWLSCTLEDHSCVKIPKDLDFAIIDQNPPKTVEGFDPTMLEGTWYKVLGVNSMYDCFDCQQNSFAISPDHTAATLGVQFRLRKPDSAADFWHNSLNERLEVDPPGGARTFHTEGKMFGLTFKENWYVTGLGKQPGKEFVFVQYKGHTLQGSYEGGFVYARQPQLPKEVLPAVQGVARSHGLDPSKLVAIDNSCPLKPALPKAGEATDMNLPQRLKYEAGFVYDLLEWVFPGTIHDY